MQRYLKVEIKVAYSRSNGLIKNKAGAKMILNYDHGIIITIKRKIVMLKDSKCYECPGCIVRENVLFKNFEYINESTRYK